MTRAKDIYAGGPVARYTLIGAAFGLTVFGLVMIYSASSVTAAIREGSSWHFFLRQLGAVVLGAGVAWVLGRYDYRNFKKTAPIAWVVGVVLLLAVFPLAAVIGGARRWIPLGIMNLQPSELVKVACVLLIAGSATEWMRGAKTTAQFLGQAALFAGVPAALILLQPDLGTTMTLVIAVGLVILLAGVEMRWLIGVVGGGIILGVLGIVSSPYRMRRFTAFLDPFADPLGKGYQTVQALLAFGTGGIDGVGLGLSRQKFFYLPEAHTDFILAIIGEEVGLIGTLGVVIGIAIFLWAGIRIAAGSRDAYGRLVAGGLTGMLGIQAIFNMAAVTGLMPITGKPLPFLSYGGSSMLVTMICVGLILSVSRYGAHAPRAVKSRPATNQTSARVPKEQRREGTDERRRNSRPRLSRVDGGRATRRGA